MKLIKGFKDGVFYWTWDCVPYSTQLWVLVAKKHVRETVPFMNKVFKEDNTVEDGVKARCSERIVKTRQNVIIQLTEKSSPWAIAHECVHAKNWIFQYHGVKPDPDNDEHEAYFLDYLVSCCVGVINECKKAKKKNGRAKRNVGKKA